MVHRIIARLMYFPTVLKLMIRSRGSKYQWYNRVDSTVILGALPFRSQSKEVDRPTMFIYIILLLYLSL